VRPDLSVVLLALDEERNLATLLPEIARILEPLDGTSETIVVDGGSRDGTARVAAQLGARVVVQPRGGYGEALRTAFAAARGTYVLTMDADLSHGADVIPRLWAARDPAGITIASRYVPGGDARTGALRLVLSRILNAVFSRGLSLNVRDTSSGFRIHPSAALERLGTRADDFDVLPETLVRAHGEGWRIREIPFHYAPRRSGTSKARLARLGVAYLRTFARLWRLRNSIAAADYDERAFDSPIPLQRAWQRRRHAIVTGEARRAGRTVDIGCGSSRILRDLPGAVGLDISFAKLRYMRRYGGPLVQGSIFALPFRDGSVEVIVCSEVIEHVPAGPGPFAEMARVQRLGGTLVLGTPDYGTWSWRMFEALYRRLAPGGYADEHITRYTHEGLVAAVSRHGYRHVRTSYVLASEMILTFERR
jgi:glycosyltransferase involved in cell wall biosynthesis